MNKNMSNADRAIRLAVVVVIAILYYTGVISGTLAIILGWVGFKMLVSHWYHVPAPLSLGVVVSILGIGILASMRANRRAEQPM